MEEKEIVIPDLDDDDDDYPLPAFSRPFGNNNGSSSSLPDTHSFGHHPQASTDSFRSGGPSTTPSRPIYKQSASYSVGGSSHGFGAEERMERPRLGKFSNGSTSSIQTTGTSIGSTPGFMAGRKGSLASLKNAFKGGANGPISPVPPVPTLDARHAAGYPALKNPFSRFEGPASPSNYYQSPKGRNGSSPGPSLNYPRKFSTATNHSSHFSQGGRSVASQGSSNWRPEDHPMPSLPPIPMRQTPSRMGGRRGSENGSLYAMSRRNGSVGGGDESFDKTPGEEALRVVFRAFKEAANAKLTRVCARPLNTQPSLSAYLEVGIDPAFDTALTSFSHCARRHARRVVELLSTWCKGHCEGISAQEVRAHLNQSIGVQMRVEEAAAIIGSRKTSTAKYIYNRALIELVKTTAKEGLPEDIGMSLENTAFNSYRAEKLEETMQFPHRKAVSQLQVDLLGELSKTRFLTVSDRFVREVAKYANSAPAKDTEARIEHLLRGMQHLKLRVYPETELEASAEFLQSLSALYANVNGQTLKVAYAETFLHLLHPVVETATAEVNHPIWSKAISIVLSRAQAMAQKSRYWQTAFPLVVTALAVSPREVFMQNMQTSVDAAIAHFKDRNLRPTAMNAFLRLLWVYLNRCGESATSTRKRVDQLLRNIFLPNGVLHPPELPLDPFIIILHYAMTRQMEYGEELLVEFLRGMSNAPGDTSLCDRATALIRALIMTLRAVEQDRPAPWPASADFSKFSIADIDASGDMLPQDLASRQDVMDLMAKAAPAISTLLSNCDRSIGSLLLSSDAVTLSANSSSHVLENAETITRKHGDVFVTYPAKHDPILRLHCTLLDATPRCLGSDANFGQIANVLSRATFSADPLVCIAACSAMRRTAQDPTRCLALVNTYRDFVFDTRHVFRDTFIGCRLLDSQFERVVKLWLDLLVILVGHQQTPTTEDGEPMEIETAFLDRCEGSALVLLCSTSVPLRRLAGQVLAATRDLHGAHRRPSAAFRYSRIIPEKAAVTRSIHLYEGSWDEADVAAMRGLPWNTASDRQRFDTAIAKDRNKLLLRIAESDQPKDSILWLAILPFFIARVHELLPGPASELRITTIATVLRLQGHVTNVALVTRTGRGFSRTSSDPAVLADHWRSFLCVLCATMPTTSPTPATPPVQRTKEAVILTPDTIGTPALFHYQCSLLSWDDPRFRDAAVYSLGTTSALLLRSLCDVLLGTVRRLADGTKLSTPGNATSKRSTLQGSLWTAIAHVFRLISPLLLDTRSQAHFHNLSSTISFVKVTFTLLSDRYIKEDFDLQSLRRSFCIVVENLANGLGKLDSSDRFFGEEIRGAVFKLCYEWCHVGRRPDVAKARESQTLQAASESYKGERDRAQYLDDLQAKTKLLSVAASEAMASLCQGKLISTDEATPAQQASEHMVEPLSVLRWIRGMFSSSSVTHHETGRKALFALIKHNWSCSRLLDEVLHQSFGEGEHFSLECSFFGVVADVLAEGHLQLPVEQVACLSLSKLGHPVVDVRLRAFQLVCLLLQQTTSPADVAALLPSVGSTAANIYRFAQKQISQRLAEIHADYARAFLAECATRLSQLEAPRRLATLSVLPAWLEHLDLSELDTEDQHAEYSALSNLMYLAIRFSDDHLGEIKDIFTSFAGHDRTRNVTALVKFLFEQGGKRKSPDFVLHAKRIMACLAQSPAGDIIFDEICGFIEPSAMAVVSDVDVPPSPMTSLANLDALMSAPSASSQSYSTGQLALLFAGELLPYRLQDPTLAHRLPALLHSAIVHCDHTGAALRDQAQAVLFQVLRGWIFAGTSGDPSHWSVAESKLAALVRGRGEAFWKSDDVGAAELAFYAPSKMTSFILKIIAILSPFQPDAQRTWGNLALTWATSCPIRHLACRSFQIFRILSPSPTPRIISDILARLSSTIASPSSEVHVFNAEVLRTFASIVQKLSPSESLNYTQIFWCAVACLSTPFEEEFAEVIDLLSNVLDKTNLSDPAVVQLLLSYRPPDWNGPAAHLQALLLIGLRSSKTAMMTFDLIRRLSSVQSDDLIDSPDTRLLHGFVAALPWMLHSIDSGETNEDLSMMALDLAAIADSSNAASFSRLLTSFARSRFRAKDDFVRQAASLLRDFMATHALDVVTLLLAFVLNAEEWMREKSMQILALILQSPEARAPLMAHGTELLQPLLRLVSTKHSAQALDILDMPITSAASAESLTSSMMSTGEIFGSISPSGWSVPKAKEAATTTRENVTAVFNTCAQETRAASVHISAMQFADIKAFNNPSQVSFDQLPSPTATAGLHMGVDNPSMGDLVGALHSLGQFFDDGLDGPRGRHGRAPSESASERRVRAIVSKPSISSPIYEHHPHPYPYITPPIRSRHQHTPSELTDTSVSSADMEPDATQRPAMSGSFASTFASSASEHERGATEQTIRQPGTTHQSQVSISSSIASDLDRSENLFALEEVGNESMTSISVTPSYEDVSQQSTPVMMKRSAVAGSVGG